VSEDDNTRRSGRPLKVDGPKFPVQDVDRALVFGELVDPGDGSGPQLDFPSYRELAQRYGVSSSVIAEYAKKHNCLRRREHTQVRVEARTDQKLIELRATAMAMSKDDTLRIIDAYVLGFERAIADNKVRFDSASDFNTMVRLKQFLEGGADSRQEIHATLSLESLQARHRQMLQTAQTTTAAERGDREPVPRARQSPLAEPDPSAGAAPVPVDTPPNAEEPVGDAAEAVEINDAAPPGDLAQSDLEDLGGIEAVLYDARARAEEEVVEIEDAARPDTTQPELPSETAWDEDSPLTSPPDDNYAATEDDA